MYPARTFSGFCLCIQLSLVSSPYSERKPKSDIRMKCSFLRHYLSRETTQCHGGKSKEIWWKWRRKLKYIFHDYAKMEMHGLIKKAFTERFNIWDALAPLSRRSESFWHTSKNEIYYGNGMENRSWSCRNENETWNIKWKFERHACAIKIWKMLLFVSWKFLSEYCALIKVVERLQNYKFRKFRAF